MKVIIGFIFIFILYGFFRQQSYASWVQHKNADPRVVQLQDYLLKKNSPLAKSAKAFIKAADTYKLDWKLLPAIAGVESGFETAGNTHDFNAWGYMCPGAPCVFDSYEQAINQVAKTISRGNAYKRFQQSGSISDLAVTYNYVHPEDWTGKIQYFMKSI